MGPNNESLSVFQLTAEPVNTRALASLSSVAGEALTRHLGKILPALMTALSQSMGNENESEVNILMSNKATENDQAIFNSYWYLLVLNSDWYYYLRNNNKNSSFKS